jgi:hypothetical protein
MFANNYISSIVESQLPEFVRADHPNFVNLLKKYYEYLELEGKTVNVGKQLYDYMDVDTTRQDLIKYFKSKIIPNFPEETELSTEKLIKAARAFYEKKGTPDSFKFLFRTLYGQEVSVYFPKEDILKASDGKWKLPQALRLSFADVLTLVPGGNVNVFISTANTVFSNGINLVSENLTVNTSIKIGEEKRKIISVNAAGDFLEVEIPFASTANNASNTQIYDSARLFRVTPNEYENFDVNLLERKLGIGEDSRTTCVIEKAVKTVDKDTGRELVELYVSNITRLFDAGENLIVDYTDENGLQKTFKSKIISLISNITLFRNRFGTVQTGRKYKPGDPVVIFGGLNPDSDEAVKAVATVRNVSTGGIESVSLIEPGYYFRADPNSEIRILSDSGIGASLLISAIWEDGGANSDVFTFNTDAVVYKRDITLNNPDGYDFENVTSFANLISNVGTTTTTVNLDSTITIASNINDYYKSFVLKVVSGTGVNGTPNSAIIDSYNGTTKIATLNTALGIAPDETSNVLIYANSTTEIGRALAFETMTLGKIRLLDLEDGGSFFEQPPVFEAISLHDTDYSIDEGRIYIPAGQFSNYNPLAQPLPTIRLNSSNNSYSTANGFYTGTRLFLDVGQTEHYAVVVDYVVTNPNTSANVKTLILDRKFENNINQININNFNLYLDVRANVRGTGRLGIILVKRGGDNYNTGDQIEFIGTGYGANANLTVVGGSITDVTLVDRGEGYYTMPTFRILDSAGNLSAGANVDLDIIGLSDGEEITAETDDIGRIQSFNIINRGFDYAETPIVSLKVVDVLTDNLAPGTIILSGDSVWQGGVTNVGSTFNGLVDEIYRPDSTNTVIRVFNYNGSINTAQPLQLSTLSGNLAVNIATQNATISFNEVNPAEERPYPIFYGDGLAKANAEFLRGLIKYDGFFLNTDGFISADKKLQDSDYYHNYSYEIQSSKSLNEYNETIKRVAHPAGMQLLSRFLIKDDIDGSIKITSNVAVINTNFATNVNTSFSSNVVYGNNSNFATTANVGDIIVINTTETAKNKQYSKLITFVDGANDIILIESPIGGIGDGRLAVTANNADVLFFANSDPVTQSLEFESNDVIQFSINGNTFDRFIENINGNVLTLNASVDATGNVLYKKLPTYNVVDYKIITFNG